MSNATIVDCYRFREPDAYFIVRKARIHDIVINDDGGGERSVSVMLEETNDIDADYRLPPNTPKSIIDRILLHTHHPVVMVIDMEHGGGIGMIHALFLGQFLFMIFTRMLWTREYGWDESSGRLSRAPLKPPQSPEVVQCTAQRDRHNAVHAAVLPMPVDMDEDDQLVVSGSTNDIDALQQFANKTGHLLMPHNMGIDMRVALANTLHERAVPVIFDQHGRVLYALLNGCTHLLTMPCWTQTALDRTVTKITGISRAETCDTLDTLQTPYRVGGEQLFLPRLPAEFYAQWTPSAEDGDYTIWYSAKDNHALLIVRKKVVPEDEIEEDYGDDVAKLRERDLLETDIDLSGWWDTRYVLPIAGATGSQRERPQMHTDCDF